MVQLLIKVTSVYLGNSWRSYTRNGKHREKATEPIDVNMYPRSVTTNMFVEINR